MTVKELIQQLEEFPPDLPIEIEPCPKQHGVSACCFYYIAPYLSLKDKKVYL